LLVLLLASCHYAVVKVRRDYPLALRPKKPTSAGSRHFVTLLLSYSAALRSIVSIASGHSSSSLVVILPAHFYFCKGQF
jgi:hypothetical protein